MALQLGQYQFTDPVSISQWSPPGEPGLYAIVAPADYQTPHKDYEVLFVGESASLDAPGLVKAHRRYWEWVRQAGSEMNLFIVSYPYPGSTSWARKVAQTDLIARCKPVCNAATTW